MSKSILFISFLLLHIAILFASPFLPVPKLDYPHNQLVESFIPKFLTSLGAFDGAHYILIAQRGYEQFQQAFFPLYPMLISVISRLTLSNYLIAGLLISWVTFFIGLKYFSKLAEIIIPKNSSSSLFYLLIFPTSFFFLTIYPESLFLFLSIGSLYFLLKRKYILAILFAALASLTKIQGVFLLIPFIIITFEINSLSIENALSQVKKTFKRLPIALAPIYGIIAYSIFLFIEYGDPLYYYHAQDAFGANRTSEGIVLIPQVIYRYINILLSSQFNFQYFIAGVELLIFSIVFLVLLFDLYKTLKNKKINMTYLSINIYSIFVLILPTLTGTLSSIPRYALVSIGFFFAMANLDNSLLKRLLIITFVLLHLILFIFFLKGYFVS